MTPQNARIAEVKILSGQDSNCGDPAMSSDISATIALMRLLIPLADQRVYIV